MSIILTLLVFRLSPISLFSQLSHCHVAISSRKFFQIDRIRKSARVLLSLWFHLLRIVRLFCDLSSRSLMDSPFFFFLCPFPFVGDSLHKSREGPKIVFCKRGCKYAYVGFLLLFFLWASLWSVCLSMIYFRRGREFLCLINELFISFVLFFFWLSLARIEWKLRVSMRKVDWIETFCW